MTTSYRILRRSLIAIGAAAVLALGPVATASAHVRASSTDATRGGYATVSFAVFNESTTGAPTTEVTIDVPDVSGVKIEAKPGWGARLNRDGDKVRSVTWTAAPDAGIPPDQFDVFGIAAKLPDADSVSFPTTQTYADGTVVKWDQGTLPGGAEPEHPAPALDLSGTSTPKPTSQPEPTRSVAPHAAPRPGEQRSEATSDTTSRILAGAALLVGALGVGLALIVRRP